MQGGKKSRFSFSFFIIFLRGQYTLAHFRHFAIHFTSWEPALTLASVMVLSSENSQISEPLVEVLMLHIFL